MLCQHVSYWRHATRSPAGSTPPAALRDRLAPPGTRQGGMVTLEGLRACGRLVRDTWTGERVPRPMCCASFPPTQAGEAAPTPCVCAYYSHARQPQRAPPPRSPLGRLAPPDARTSGLGRRAQHVTAAHLLRRNAQNARDVRLRQGGPLAGILVPGARLRTLPTAGAG